MSAPTGDLSRLPSMTVLLEAATQAPALAKLPRAVRSDALKEALAQVRAAVQRGESGVDVSTSGVLAIAATVAGRLRVGRLRRVINATGVVLHTGLGRSVLSRAAARHLAEISAGYCNLELDLATGQRGRRGEYVEGLIRRLTDAESALVVNNNAAATLLALRALAQGKEVIVSRGQLVEIGGSYRLPDVMSASGATLREVGATNKTHLRDYEAAIGPRTGLIMHVHTSNYRIVGFSESPGAAELAALAKSRGLPMLDDLGSGALLDHPAWTNAGEPTVGESLRSGADLVAFSGDKLLGGPQAGILIGKAAIIEQLRNDPITRAMRIDKLTIAALEATLEVYLSGESAKTIPTLAALSESHDSLCERAAALLSQLKSARSGDSFELADDHGYAGGGSLPARPLASRIIRWRPRGQSVQDVCDRLRLNDPAVLTRINDDAIVFDVRTIAADEYGLVADAVTHCAASASS